jgi:hypothetical protein
VSVDFELKGAQDTDDEFSMMDQTHVMYYYWQQPLVNTMPPITRVQAKKQALSGPMRVVPEGYQGAWSVFLNDILSCPPLTILQAW